jgi:cytochrome c biogenesis protein CcmG, thiol:disulfide interchange protein DsbE
MAREPDQHGLDDRGDGRAEDDAARGGATAAGRGFPPRRRRRVSWSAVGWVLVLGYVGYMMWPQVAATFGVAAGSDEVPPFELATLEGDVVSDALLRGDVVLLNFWATWCPPCRLEMPGFQRIWEERRDEGFTILGVSTDAAGPEVVREFLEERGITYPVAMATGAIVRDFEGVRALPMSYLIDRQGRVRHVVRGYFNEVSLRQAVDRLLREPGE